MYTLVPAAASASDEINVTGFSLPTIMAKLGHTTMDLLKTDIEGAEYSVLEAMAASVVRPRQLLVEFHHRFPSLDQGMTQVSLNKLRRVGYRIFAVSDTGREVSLIHMAPGQNLQD